MDAVVKVFTSHQASAAADRAYYQKMIPQERLDLLVDLIAQYRGNLEYENASRFERVYRVTQLREG